MARILGEEGVGLLYDGRPYIYSSNYINTKSVFRVAIAKFVAEAGEAM